MLEVLDDQRRYIASGCRAYDEGDEREVKRIAMPIRVLLHDTGRSDSVLGAHLGVKDSMLFLDSAYPLQPGNLVPEYGLLVHEVTATGGRHVPRLDRMAGEIRWVPFLDWWRKPVLKLERTWSRWELVDALAHTEGVGHLDAEGRIGYRDAASHSGWTAVTGGVARPFAPGVVLPSMRQIGFEMLRTLEQNDIMIRMGPQPGHGE